MSLKKRRKGLAGIPSLDVTCRFRERVVGFDDLVNHYHARIVLTRYDEACDDEVLEQAGTLDIVRICFLEAYNSRIPLRCVLEHQPDISEICQSLFEPNAWTNTEGMPGDEDRWSDAVMDEFSEVAFDLYDVLLIRNLRVHPQFRGQNLGLWAARATIRRLGQKALAIVHPTPLQFETGGRKHPDIAAFTTDHQKAVQKLTDYLKAVGFVPIRGTPLLAVSERTLVDAEELGFTQL